MFLETSFSIYFYISICFSFLNGLVMITEDEQLIKELLANASNEETSWKICSNPRKNDCQCSFETHKNKLQ